MINKAILMGRIGSKKYKQSKNGSYFLILSIATNKKYIDFKGLETKVTQWHNIHFFNNLTEIVNKYANVGDLIYVEGEITSKKIEENGKQKIINFINGNEVKFIPNSKINNSELNNDGLNNKEEYEDDNIPF